MAEGSKKCPVEEEFVTEGKTAFENTIPTCQRERIPTFKGEEYQCQLFFNEIIQSHPEHGENKQIQPF